MNKDLFSTLPRTFVRGNCAFMENSIKVTPENGVVQFVLTREEFGQELDQAKRLYLRYLADMDGAVIVDVDFYRFGEEKRSMNFFFQCIPTRKIEMDVEFHYLDSHSFFFEPVPGTLKAQCDGMETELCDIEKIVFTMHSPHCTYFDSMEFFGLELTDEKKKLTVEGEPMVDELGQWIQQEWPNKTHSKEEMISFLKQELEAAENGRGYPEGFSEFGGTLSEKFDATGYFHTAKRNGRWWLVDPLGCGYFANAICYGTRMGVHGFVDGMKEMFTWLPDENDPEFKDAWTYASAIPEYVKRNGKEAGRTRRMFNFARANMIRAFGADKWWDSWVKINASRFKSWGYNAVNVGVNNYEDENVHEYLKEAKIPFVWTLKHFPLTEKRIFRDFPDVFSEEYRERAAAFAKEQLTVFLKNPYMIGYFITNEPEWRFQDVNMAKRVFAAKEPLESKKTLVLWLKNRYVTVTSLNAAWGSDYENFEALCVPEAGLDKRFATAAAQKDFAEMHILLVNQYESVVHEELKKVDPDHLDLGMRYSQAGKSVMGGCRNHDLFSFNCYFESPKPSLQGSAKIEDMPMIIGEWQVGCTNNGKLIGGLLFCDSPSERGKAIANYMQDAMTDPNCVGISYFEFNDQPLLGRFDGECMEHGLIDICNRPYEETIARIRETGVHMYDFMHGTRAKDCYEVLVKDRIGHNEMF